MEKRENITRMTFEEAQAMIARGETKTDWAKVNAMTREEIERNAEEEDGPWDPSQWRRVATPVFLPKQDVHIRLDADVLAWFRSHGPRYQTRINAVLRSFVAAHQKRARPAADKPAAKRRVAKPVRKAVKKPVKKAGAKRPQRSGARRGSTKR